MHRTFRRRVHRGAVRQRRSSAYLCKVVIWSCIYMEWNVLAQKTTRNVARESTTGRRMRQSNRHQDVYDFGEIYISGGGSVQARGEGTINEMSQLQRGSQL